MIVISGTIPGCELFDKQVNIVDEFKYWNPHGLKYPDQKVLSNKVYKVRICSAESPQKFQVQPEIPTKAQYENLYDELQSFEPPRLRNPMINDACIVKLEGLKMRGIVVGPSTTEIFKVKAVDFGFVEDYHASEIFVIVKEFMELPFHAHQCCLKEFHGVRNVDQVSSCNFEDICGGNQVFQMRIDKFKEGTYIVELEDSSTGAKVNLLQEVNKGNAHNRSDWTVAPSSIGSHFKKRRRSNETIDTLSESPVRLQDFDVGNRTEDWDATSDKLKNSTVIGVAGTIDWDLPESQETQKKKVSDDWTDLGVLELERSFESDEPAASSKENMQHSSPSSTSGVSSAACESFKGEAVRITAVTNPTDFFIQKMSTIQDYEANKKKVQHLANVQPPLTIFTTDSHCLAFHPFDNLWCRAIILDADSDEFLVTVRCLDDGTTFSIQDRRHLKIASIATVFQKYFSIRCSLPIRYNRTYETEVNQYLLKLMNADLNCQTITEYKLVMYVELQHDGKNLADVLVATGKARRQFVAPTGPAYINYVKSATDFCIQMSSSTDALKQIVNFTNSYNYQEVRQPKTGMLVLGRYEEDKCWYRSKILSKVKNGYQVYFVDHGHSDIVQKIGLIYDQTIADIQPIGIRCSLVVPTGIESFSKCANEKLEQISQNGHKKVFVKMVTPGDDFAYVNILEDNEDILQKLMPLEHANNKEGKEEAAAVTRETIDVDSDDDDDGF